MAMAVATRAGLVAVFGAAAFWAASCSSAPVRVAAPEPPSTAPGPAGGVGGVAAQDTALPAALRSALRVATVEVEPARIEVGVGESFLLGRLSVRVLDAAGAPVEAAAWQAHLQSPHASLEAGSIVARQPGTAMLIVFAMTASLDEAGELVEDITFDQVSVVVRAGAVASLAVSGPPGALPAGTSTRMKAVATTAQGFVRDDATLRWSSTEPGVASVDEFGYVYAHAAGTAVIVATSEGVADSVALRVVVNPVAQLELSPAAQTVRTGDVVRLQAVARDAAGRAIETRVEYALSGDGVEADAGAVVYQDGAFVAERPGIYRVIATAGRATSGATIHAVARDVAMDAVQVGVGLIAQHPTSDLWVFSGVDGRDYAYHGTHSGGQKMYAWDVTDPAAPVLTDSIIVDARVVNDVKVNEAGTIAVITREGASDRRNGIVVLDLADPAHPQVASEYTDHLTGGVHNTFIVGDLVYAVNDGTLDVHIIDLSDPRAPREVGRWGIDGPGKYLHDIWIVDGLGYVSYWDDGVYIIDVGDGRWGGTPTAPAVVANHRYRTRWGSESFGNTHVAFPYRNAAGKSYLFVGDEIFGCEVCVSRAGSHEEGPRGYVHVLDITDAERPIAVARYRVPEAGVHNIWVEDDKLYAAYYQGGLRVVDVSGELRGELYEQGREIAWFPTGSPRGYGANSPFAWGPQPYKGNIYVSDLNSGLWIVRLAPKRKIIG